MIAPWSAREDLRPAPASTPFRTMDAEITAWLIELDWPTSAVARFTIRAYRDGTIGTVQGCMWTDADREDGA